VPGFPGHNLSNRTWFWEVSNCKRNLLNINQLSAFLTKTGSLSGRFGGNQNALAGRF
jgi:hypothetical protein